MALLSDCYYQRRKLVEAVEAVEESVTAHSPHDLSNYLASMQAKTFTDMSALELDDMRIPGKDVTSI